MNQELYDLYETIKPAIPFAASFASAGLIALRLYFHNREEPKSAETRRENTQRKSAPVSKLPELIR